MHNLTNCECGGILDIVYDYDYIKANLTKEKLKSRPNTMRRYRELLPVEETTPDTPLRVGWSPLYEEDRLAKLLGLKKLWVKDDGQNPTASLKDRASAMAVAKAKEAGAEIIACHNDGLVECQTSGWAGAGGICGFHKVTITACYHIGQVTGDSAIGAIVGEHNSGNISYCYWNGDQEGIPAGGGGSQTGNAKFGAAWPQPSTHEAWRTTADTPAAYWRTLGRAGGGYPKLAWEK